jgi:hypothetical protein
MRRTRFHGIAAAVAAFALMVGVGTAIAASGNGSLKLEAQRISGQSTLDATVAKSLGTTTAKLKAAIKAAAVARIDAALAADEITSDEATTLKDALDDGTIPAARLATAAGVAKQLGTTEAKLNAAYSDARKAQAKARVDQAVTDGKITQSYADELKAQIDDATFPGFGAGPGSGPGGHHGHGGPGFGLGFGPPDGGNASGSGSSSGSSSSSSSLNLGSLAFA